MSTDPSPAQGADPGSDEFDADPILPPEDSGGDTLVVIDNPYAGSAGMSPVERERRIRQLETDVQELQHLTEIEGRVNSAINDLITLENRVVTLEATLNNRVNETVISEVLSNRSSRLAVAYLPRAVLYTTAIGIMSIGIFLGNLNVIIAGGVLLLILGIHFTNAPNIE